MKFSQMQPAHRKATVEYVDARSHQLNELIRESVKAGLNQAFLANAGGAAAILGFLGAYHEAAARAGAIEALAMFLMGIVLTILTHAAQYHFFTNLFDGWKRDAIAFYGDQIDESDLIGNDDKRMASPVANAFIYGLGYGALLAFVAGCIIGIWSFWP